jgi:hypothetical protein
MHVKGKEAAVEAYVLTGLRTDVSITGSRVTDVRDSQHGSEHVVDGGQQVGVEGDA